MGTLALWFALGVRMTFAATFAEPARHFAIDYDDSTWEVVPSRSTTNLSDADRVTREQTWLTLQRKSADDGYHARFTVVTDEKRLPAQASDPDQLLAYQQHALGFMRSQRFHILGTTARDLPIVGSSAVEIVANQRDFGLAFQQVIFLHGERVFLLTGSARTSKAEAYRSEVDRLFSSFRFTRTLLAIY